MKLSLSGGTPIVLASGQAYPCDIAVDAANVYWTNGGSGASDSVIGTVMKAPLGGFPTARQRRWHPGCGAQETSSSIPPASTG
jgi:hypothetical protein